MVVSAILSLVLPKIYKAELYLYPLGSPDIFSLTSSQSTVRRPVVPLMSEDIATTQISLMKTNKMGELIAEDVKERSAKAILKRLDVDVDEDSRLFKVTIRDRNPEIAAKIANVFGEKVNRLNGEFSLVTTENTLEFVRQEIKDRKVKLDESRAAMEAFQRKHGVISLDKEVSRLVNNRASLLSRIDANNIKLRETEETVAALKEQMGEEAKLYNYDEMIASDPILQSLRSRLSDLEVQLAVKKTQMTELHPEIIQLETEIETVREEITKEMDRLTSSYTKAPGSFYESLRQRMVGLLVEKMSVGEETKAIEDILEKTKEEISNLPALMKEYADLSFELRRNENLYQLLNQREAELDIQAKRDQQMYVVVEPAKPPKNPSFPSLTINLIIAFTLGLTGGVLYVLLLNYIERAKATRLEQSQVYQLLMEGEEGK
jgi:uncharacterized protein involved in exopolysaccharide biosynthesis